MTLTAKRRETWSGRPQKEEKKRVTLKGQRRETWAAARTNASSSSGSSDSSGSSGSSDEDAVEHGIDTETEMGNGSSTSEEYEDEYYFEDEKLSELVDIENAFAE